MDVLKVKQESNLKVQYSHLNEISEVQVEVGEDHVKYHKIQVIIKYSKMLKSSANVVDPERAQCLRVNRR